MTENQGGQRPGSGFREGKLSNPRGRCARTMHAFFLLKIYEKPARPRLAGAMRQFSINQVNIIHIWTTRSISTLSVIDRGKLLQYKLIHVHCTQKSTRVPVSPVSVTPRSHNMCEGCSDFFWSVIAVRGWRVRVVMFQKQLF